MWVSVNARQRFGHVPVPFSSSTLLPQLCSYCLFLSTSCWVSLWLWQSITYFSGSLYFRPRSQNLLQVSLNWCVSGDQHLAIQHEHVERLRIRNNLFKFVLFQLEYSCVQEIKVFLFFIVTNRAPFGNGALNCKHLNGTTNAPVIDTVHKFHLPRVANNLTPTPKLEHNNAHITLC